MEKRKLKNVRKSSLFMTDDPDYAATYVKDANRAELSSISIRM